MLELTLGEKKQTCYVRKVLQRTKEGRGIYFRRKASGGRKVLGYTETLRLEELEYGFHYREVAMNGCDHYLLKRAWRM